MDYAKHTSLPEEPDGKKVEELMMEVNGMVARDEI